MLPIVDGVAGVPRHILDGAAGQARRGGQADGFGDGLGRVAEAVFQVGADWQIGGGDDG